MKRSWMGLGMLVLLLALSLGVTWAMMHIHQPISEDLQQAAEYIQQGDWTAASQSFQKARNAWEKWSHMRACFADHSPVEEIDAGFAALEIYCSARENVAFAAASMELSRKVAAVGEAHELVWWNLL